MSKLWTENVPGNLHQAAVWVNTFALANQVLAMGGGVNYTVVVFRAPDDFDKEAHFALMNKLIKQARGEQ